DVPAAQDDLLPNRLRARDAVHCRRAGGAVVGHRKARRLQALRVDVAQDCIARGIVSGLQLLGRRRIGLRRGHRRLRLALAEQLFTGFLDETEQSHGCTSWLEIERFLLLTTPPWLGVISLR